MPILIAACSAVVYGIGDWCGGRSSRRQPAFVVTGVGQAVSLVGVLVAVIVMGRAVPVAHDWWWAGAGGIVGAVGLLSLYRALADGDITIVAPTSAVVGAAVPVVVGLLQGERPGVVRLAGVVVGVAAIALVSGAIGPHQHDTPPRVIMLAVLAGSCFGALFIAFQHTDSGSGMWPLLIARFTSVPFLLVTMATRGIRPVAHRPSLVIAVVAGVFDMAANVLYLVAVREGMLSVVAVVASLYPASTVVLAFVIDRERVSRWQGIGLAAGALALVLVSLA